MAYNVNWIEKRIFVPVSDMILVSGTEYQLDTDLFRREIRRLEWEFTEGLWADQILTYIEAKVVGGVRLPPIVEIINDYEIEFDPTASRVVAVGANNNLLDVQFINGVSLGVSILGAGGLTPQQQQELNEIRAYSKKASDNAEQVNEKCN